mgnify:CR=1 FL=1
MDCGGKKPLKTVIANFYKLDMNKGKEYTFKNIKKFSVHKATIYRWMKKIDQNVVIKMFEKLKGKVHAANENGLNSLLKI